MVIAAQLEAGLVGVVLFAELDNRGIDAVRGRPQVETGGNAVGKGSEQG